MTVELRNLKRGSLLRVRVEGVPTNAVFHHIDGMYSLCTLEGESQRMFHLKAWTPMVEVDGRWEIA